MLFASCAFAIPTVFNAQTSLPDSSNSAVSRATSLMLLIAYVGLLVYHLLTHKSKQITWLPDPAAALDEQASSSRLQLWVSVPAYIGLTILLYFVTDNIVASIQQLTTGNTTIFFGYIIFPILNCDLAAIEQGERSMDLMFAVTVGKSVQTGLLVAPVLVTVGWAMGFDDIALSFDLSLIVALFMSLILLMQLGLLSPLTW